MKSQRTKHYAGTPIEVENDIRRETKSNVRVVSRVDTPVNDHGRIYSTVVYEEEIRETT